MSSKRNGLCSDLSASAKLVDANCWLENRKIPQIVSYWLVARNRWWIQARHSVASSYLRDLKSVRRVGFAVIGDHLTPWAFDGTERKLRAIIQGLDRELATLFVSHENQAQAPRAVLLP